MIEQKPGSGPLGGEVPWTDLHVGDDLSDLRETAHSVRFGRWRIRFQGMTIHCHDLMSFYYSVRDIFLGGLYDFGNPGGKAR
ncbi:MAG: hypothetical protein Q8S17_09080, partial [Humidesulfovibrio sp.]|nr:hypothetical protein [Humidesulfovibrio sp.]